MTVRGSLGRADKVSSPFITDVEEKQNVVRVIDDPKECLSIYQKLASSTKSEALLLLPSAFELSRAQRLGIISNLTEEADKRGVNVRILCPVDESNNDLVRSIQDVYKRVKISTYQKYSFKSIFLIVDSNQFIRAELKNPDADDFESVFGLAVYSNSKPSVESFKTFFDIAWNQITLSEEFRNRERAKDDFLAVASHELRTPIQPILGYAYLAAKGKVSQEEAWDGVLKEARRLQQLANDILDVTKFESGNMIYFMDHEKINRLLASIANSVKKDLPDGLEIAVEYDEAEADLQIWMDRSRMSQVITNIIGNAMKFTEQGSIKIQSKAMRDENKIEIRVSDTGKGISKDVMPMLFQKFATRGHGEVQNRKGSGLGLYICRAIVNGHDGEISAFNNGDRGATFVISLPISNNKRPE